MPPASCSHVCCLIFETAVAARWEVLGASAVLLKETRMGSRIRESMCGGTRATRRPPRASVGTRGGCCILRTWGGLSTTPHPSSLTISFHVLVGRLEGRPILVSRSAGCGQARGLGVGLVGVGISSKSSSLDSSCGCGSGATDSFAASASPEMVSEVPATFAGGRSSGWISSSLAARGRLSNGSEGVMRTAHDLQEHCLLLRCALKFGLQIHGAKCHYWRPRC